MKQLLASAIARGQAAGLVDDTLPAAALATMLLAVLDGSKAIRLRDPAVDGGHAREMLLALVCTRAQKAERRRDDGGNAQTAVRRGADQGYVSRRIPTIASAPPIAMGRSSCHVNSGRVSLVALI